MSRIGLDLATQPADLIVDRPIKDVRGPSFRQIHQLIPGENKSGAFEEDDEEAEFRRAQRYLFCVLVTGQLPRIRVQRPSGKGKASAGEAAGQAGRSAGPSQYGLDPCQQLSRAEGFGR